MAAVPTLLAAEIPDAAKWAEILSYIPRLVRLTSNFNLATSSTTLADVTGLVLAVEANTNYMGILVVAASLSSGSTEDIKYAFTWPSGGVMDLFPAGPGTSVTAAALAENTNFATQISATSGVTAIAIGVVGAHSNTLLPFVLRTAGSAGNLQVQAAQNTSGANTVTIRLGSHLMLQKYADP